MLLRCDAGAAEQRINRQATPPLRPAERELRDRLHRRRLAGPARRAVLPQHGHETPAEFFVGVLVDAK
jgi:hypothetical protein